MLIFLHIALVVLLVWQLAFNMKININLQSTAMFFANRALVMALYEINRLVNTPDILSEVKINASQAVHTPHHTRKQFLQWRMISTLVGL